MIAMLWCLVALPTLSMQGQAPHDPKMFHESQAQGSASPDDQACQHLATFAESMAAAAKRLCKPSTLLSDYQGMHYACLFEINESSVFPNFVQTLLAS